MEYHTVQNARRTRRRPARRRNIWMVVAAVLAAVLFLSILLMLRPASEEEQVRTIANLPVPGWVDVQLIGVDGTSRRGEKLEAVKDIVIHYIGNPGTTAQQNRDYFENPDSTVSSHFVIGLEGEVIQCLPLDEKSSASNDRNKDTLSVEVCHPDESGRFTEASYATLISLVAFLCDATGLDSGDIIRHHDVTGKMCPLYYVENEEAWQQLKQDVQQELDSGSTTG